MREGWLRKGRESKALVKDLSVSVFKFLLAAGLMGLVVTSVHSYFVDGVSLEFKRPYGRYYEFHLLNETPVDQNVISFVVTSPGAQSLIYKTTRDMYGEVGEDGEKILPGGNVGWIPAMEFHELDGKDLPAGKTYKFRVPPLNSKDYMQPVAAIFEIKYDVIPSSKLLAGLERFLRVVGLRNTYTKIRYLVVDNYWHETRSESLGEAVRIACRDDESLRSNLCDSGRY